MSVDMSVGQRRYEIVRKFANTAKPKTFDMHMVVEWTETLLDQDAWREFWNEPTLSWKQFDTVPEFLAWMHLNVDRLTSALRLAGRDDLAGRVLVDGTPPVNPNGTNQHTKPGGSSTTPSIGRDRSDTYVIARLKRDHPDVAAQVRDGTLTAHAAAIKTGIRKPRATYVTNDVDQAVRSMLKHYDADELMATIKAVAS